MSDKVVFCTTMQVLSLITTGAPNYRQTTQIHHSYHNHHLSMQNSTQNHSLTLFTHVLVLSSLSIAKSGQMIYQYYYYQKCCCTVPISLLIFYSICILSIIKNNSQTFTIIHIKMCSNMDDPGQPSIYNCPDFKMEQSQTLLVLQGKPQNRMWVEEMRRTLLNQHWARSQPDPNL